MTPAERQKAFDRAQRQQLRSQIDLVRNTQAELERLMNTAVSRVQAILNGAPSDYQRWQLPQIEQEIQRALATFRGQAQGVLTTAADTSWDGGRGLVDAPLAAGGVSMAGVTPLLTQTQLAALKSFMTDRIRDVTADAVNRVNTQLGLVTLGAQTPFEATKNVASILGDEALNRATTITRTELGRVFSVASQARLDQAVKAGVPMDKVWRRSGKPHQRPGHALADGQRVAADESFSIVSKDGEVIQLRYPRDPKAPPGETINCGCISIPKVRGWNSTTPDKVPYSPLELQTNPLLRQILEAPALT